MAALLTGYAETGLPSSGAGAAGFVRRRKSDGAFWNTSGTPAFEAYSAANIAQYFIAATETGATGLYTASDPAPTTEGDAWLVKRAGASLAQSDLSGGLRWELEAGAASVTATVSDADKAAIAAAVLGASAPGGYAAGTVGFKIGRLGTVGATYPDDVPEPGELGLVPGDTYSEDLGNRKQLQSPPGFPDPAGKTVTLGVGLLNSDTVLFTTNADLVTWDSGTGVVTALFPFTAAQTAMLDPETGRYGFSWEVDYGANAERTGGLGECVVTRKYSD